jgi:SAM-dependent methyltransferase
MLRQDLIAEIFAASSVEVGADSVLIDGSEFPIRDGVIVLQHETDDMLKKTVVESFGREWQEFPDIKSDHRTEFDLYFDVVDIQALEGKVVADLGCGMGRWSALLLEKIQPRLLVLYDYSDAIFVARRLIGDRDNVLFFKGDLEKIPFTPGSFDLSFCLGVLHHIPSGIAPTYARIASTTRSLLCYVYYDFENRNMAFRSVFKVQDVLRQRTSRIRSKSARLVVSHLLTVFLYYPFILAGATVRALGFCSHRLPLSFYAGCSYGRVRQDAYDRFFTPLEYRVSSNDVLALATRHFAKVEISDREPFWHFLGYN